MRLNLGCGRNKMDGFVNVDVDPKCEPDLIFDIDCGETRWPWDDQSIEEVQMHHVLEHIGQSPRGFIWIFQHLYRVMKPGGLLHIRVPHPWSDDFYGDPTHVRAITPHALQLFSKKLNQNAIDNGWSNSPLALQYDVDFELERTLFVLKEPWMSLIGQGGAGKHKIDEALKSQFNVASEIQMWLRRV